MKITVNKDNVKIEEFDIVHEGEHRVNKCSFSFSEEYTEDLVKKAIFTSQNSSIEVTIIDNECDIPTEILKARNIVLLGVYAYKVVDDKLDLRYSPSPDAFKINSGSYIEGASESEEITPSQFEQYMQALNDGLNKVEESLKKMDSVTSSATQLVDNINQKLENGDFIGPEGPEGPQGVPGKDGVNGQDGIGITTITSGQSTVEEDKTITPVTVQKTDGSSQIFKVEAKNGANGKDGLNGKDGVNGQNGQDGTTPNIQIGTVETLEPNEHATVTRTGTDEEPVFNFGIPKGQQGEKGLDGANGTDGKDATINGQNTVEITTDNNITLEQQENILKFGLDSQLIPKNNAEGTDNTFDDGIESKLYALGGDGKSEQVVTTGKNKLQITTFNDGTKSKTLNGVTATINDNGTISLSGTASAETQFYLTKNDFSLENGDGYFWCNSPSSNCRFEFVASINGEEKYLNSYSTTPNTFNITSSFVYSGSTIKIASGTTTNVTLTPMVANGTFTEYEPYTGGQPSPSPDYEQPINSIEGSVEFTCNGRNLLPNNASSKTINDVTCTVKDDGSVIVNGTATARVNLFLFADSENPIKLIPGNYSLNSGKTSGGSFLQIEVKNLLGESRYITSSNTPNNNVVINEGDVLVAGYIGIDQGQTATNDHIYPVFQKGATSTKYEQYVEPNEVTFNLNDEKLRSVGDVKDELVVDLSTGDYYKVENVTEDILDGDENWEFSGFTNAKILSVFLNRGDMKPTSRFQMDNFKYSTGVSVATNYEYCSTGGNSIRIGIDKTRLVSSDIVGFKQWLSTHNTVVDFVLQNPTTKKLGTLSAENLAKLKTFKGYNNVTVNTNLGLMNIRFTYGLDIKKYVDNKIAQLSEQLIKGE